MYIDLFSDTATRPTPQMRQAMFEAAVGDEQRGEDPTVNALEERVAALLGKERALFLPSATMANQIALKVHTQPGDEVIVEARSHIANFEAGGPGLISGVLLRAIQGQRGLFTGADVKAAARRGDSHTPPTVLLCVENTHNMGGGTVWPVDQLTEVCETARERGLALHLDGARLLNAAVKLGVPAHVLAAPFDTVTFCLSKGLGCPVGGLLAGDARRIERARRYKQALGGAMRQAGVIAAAGLYALERHVDRLADDHRRAHRLAEGLARLPGIEIELDRVQTNMVFFRITDTRFSPGSFVAALKERGLILSHGEGDELRAVTHLDVDDADIDRALQIIAETLAAGPGTGDAARTA